MIGCLIVGLCGCVYVYGWLCACLCVVMCGYVCTAWLCLFVCACVPAPGKGEGNGGDAAIKKTGGNFGAKTGVTFCIAMVPHTVAHACVHVC